MYKNYLCPVCKHWESFPIASAPVMQPLCKTSGCHGRLVYESQSASSIPNPPGPAPVLSAADIDYATRPIIRNYDGTFCQYRVEQNRRSYTIAFTGTNKSNGKVYALNLSALEGEYEIPAYANVNDPTSQLFIKNARGETDWEPGPTRLPKVQGPPPQRKVISSGHEANLLSSPLRVQLGSQDENDQHSGSGMIHLMFSHDRDSLEKVQQLIHELLFPQTKIKAIYKTKALLHGYHRYAILAGGNATLPFEMIVEGREGYLRLLTVYKMSQSITAYNKYKSKPNDYSRLYSANADVY